MFYLHLLTYLACYKKAHRWGMRDISWAHKKIFAFLLLLLVINCVNAALTAYICVGNSELKKTGTSRLFLM